MLLILGRVVVPDILVLVDLHVKSGVFGHIDYGLGRMIVAGHAHCKHADAYVFCLGQTFGAGEKCTARSQDVVNQEDVTVGRRFGSSQGEDTLDVGTPFVTAEPGLRLVVPTAHDDVLADRDTCQLTDAARYLCGLVVTALALTLAGQGNGYHHVNAVEESRIKQVLCHHPSEENADPRLTTVLQADEDLVTLRPWDVVHIGRGTPDGNASPEQAFEPVACPAADLCARQGHEAGGANHFLARSEPSPANHTGMRHEDMPQVAQQTAGTAEEVGRCHVGKW